MKKGDKSKTEKITLNYSITKDSEIDTRIVISFDNTGLNIDNPDHLHFIDVMSKVIGSQMYAKANNIPMENVIY